jgi:hypothetical protein
MRGEVAAEIGMKRGGGNPEAGFEPGTGPREIGRAIRDGDLTVADGPKVQPSPTVGQSLQLIKGPIE